MDELDAKIQKIMKSTIEEPVEYEQKILNTIRNSKNKEKGGTYLMKKRIIATACVSLMLITSIGFAMNIKNSEDNRGLGQGIENGIKNGYIENVEMDFNQFDNTGTQAKIENFFMDDLNLSINFSFKFDENSKVNLDKLIDMELTGLIIRDEENRIIYNGTDEDEFKRYCKENNLSYKFNEFNENHMNCGLNAFINNKENNIVTLTYNIYSDNFPKSKKLYISLATVKMIEFENDTKNEYNLKGYWNTEIQVPEKMYNRTTDYYKVINCDNKDFEVYLAGVTDTGFEVGVKVPTKINSSKSTISNENSYVENENGQKFNHTLSLSRRYKNDYLEDEFDYYETFEMTKYDATDKIKVVLNYYGAPVTIELEKMK